MGKKTMKKSMKKIKISKVNIFCSNLLFKDSISKDSRGFVILFSSAFNCVLKDSSFLIFYNEFYS